MGRVSEETSALDIVTLVVAIVGVSLAFLSLGWQAATFYLSGGRVRLELRRGALQRGPGGTIRSTAPLKASARQMGLLRDQGFTEEVLVVVVRNRGRLPISIEDVSAMTSDGWGFQRLDDPENPTLPYRLQGGAKEAWHVELRPFQMVVDGDGKARRAWMVVELGTGKMVRTKRRFRPGGSLLVTPRQG